MSREWLKKPLGQALTKCRPQYVSESISVRVTSGPPWQPVTLTVAEGTELAPGISICVDRGLKELEAKLKDTTVTKAFDVPIVLEKAS